MSAKWIFERWSLVFVVCPQISATRVYSKSRLDDHLVVPLKTNQYLQSVPHRCHRHRGPHHQCHLSGSCGKSGNILTHKFCMVAMRPVDRSPSLRAHSFPGPQHHLVKDVQEACLAVARSEHPRISFPSVWGYGWIHFFGVRARAVMNCQICQRKYLEVALSIRKSRLNINESKETIASTPRTFVCQEPTGRGRPLLVVTGRRSSNGRLDGQFYKVPITYTVEYISFFQDVKDSYADGDKSIFIRICAGSRRFSHSRITFCRRIIWIWDRVLWQDWK